MSDYADILIVGAGAAGLMAAIWAARTNPHRSVTLLDSAAKLGAKILISGGGRCNVTHDHVEADAYAGSSRHAIKKILKRFDVPATVQFFSELGVKLKREGTGKLFPVTDSARTILDALLRAADQSNVRILHPRRVEFISRESQQFCVGGDWGQLYAGKVILATGGKSLPKSGSDGHGYQLAVSLGHHITRRIFPALVPLTLPRDHFICQLSGITLPATIELRSPTGKKLLSFTDSTLCTHFGLSGPSVLDFSRYYIDATLDNPQITATLNWLPEMTAQQIESELLHLGKTTPLRFLSQYLPERLVRALCEHAGIAPGITGVQLTREQRRTLTHLATQLPLPITGNRGFTYAEVTAGGVPLSEIHLEMMESRLCPGLYLCGEICDVDGRIGGYNFQWAWASGYVAGVSV